MHVTVLVVEIGARVPSVELREKVTQPVDTDEAAEPVATLGMQEEAVQLSGVFKNRKKKAQIAVL